MKNSYKMSYVILVGCGRVKNLILRSVNFLMCVSKRAKGSMGLCEYALLFFLSCGAWILKKSSLRLDKKPFTSDKTRRGVAELTSQPVEVLWKYSAINKLTEPSREIIYKINDFINKNSSSEDKIITWIKPTHKPYQVPYK